MIVPHPPGPSQCHQSRPEDETCRGKAPGPNPRSAVNLAIAIRPNWRLVAIVGHLSLAHSELRA